MKTGINTALAVMGKPSIFDAFPYVSHHTVEDTATAPQATVGFYGYASGDDAKRAGIVGAYADRGEFPQTIASPVQIAEHAPAKGKEFNRAGVTALAAL